MSKFARKTEDQHTDSVDYYFENGLLVFTAKYHKKRGHCCQNGCRHCPYGFRKKH